MLIFYWGNNDRGAPYVQYTLEELLVADGNTLPRNLPGLTGLRFWAAALVALYHFSHYLGGIPVLSQVTRFGNSGVTFFFVLSGFVLAWTYHDRPSPLAVFYWRRFARIWPLHILTTIISLYCWHLAGHPIGQRIDVETLWPAFFLIHSWWPAHIVIQGGSGASWSLSVEAFFYAIFPVLLWGLMKIRSTVLLTYIPSIATLVALTIWLIVPAEGIGDYSRPILLAYFPPVRATQFIAGVALGIAIRRGWLPRFGFPVSAFVIAGFFALMFGWSEVVEPTSPWYPRAPAQLFSIVPYSMLIVAVAKADIRQSKHLFRGRFIQLLGHASFALYLIHVPTALVWVYLFGKPTTLTGIVIAWLIVGSLAVAASICLYKAFEHPVERWLRALGPKSAKA